MGLGVVRLLAIIVCASSGVSKASVIDGPRYHVIDLGTIGAAAAYAATINASNQVAGTAWPDPAGPSGRAFFHNGSTMLDIGTLGTESGAIGINNLGDVVGYATVDAASHAFLYDGTMHDLGTMGAQWAYAAAINDSRVIVGSRSFDNVTYRAFLYANGIPEELALLGGDYSQAFAINNAGQIVGHSSVVPGDAPLHAFLYDDGDVTDLGTLGGTGSVALGINSLGHVVGAAEYTEPEQYLHAFVWRDGVMTDLGDLGGLQIWAYGINDSGTIVGEGMLPNDGPLHGWVYTDAMYDLNDLLDEESEVGRSKKPTRSTTPATSPHRGI